MGNLNSKQSIEKKLKEAAADNNVVIYSKNHKSTDSLSNVQPNVETQLISQQEPVLENSDQYLNLDSCIQRLLDCRNSKVVKNICLKQNEIFGIFIQKLIAFLIIAICMATREVLLEQPILLELNPSVNVVGDIHGQYGDLLRIFDLLGYPPTSNYLFLGDYVDRGKQSLETILLLFCYKIKFRDNFFILRGNHECYSVNRVYGFYDECKRRSSLKVWRCFGDVFNCLPVAAIIAGKIFCVHGIISVVISQFKFFLGGLSPDLNSMEDIRNLTRPRDVPDSGLLNDLLWSDPSEHAIDWEESERGVSYCEFSNVNSV
ncbi:hypothetical protein HK099_003831 [Clydaea vesicula]|uniref:Serine/threonine-protein phosphatase n=1 Tax=Clydaea vesicula TaxID=447962 RepID=A0AAD5U160_9FUNG|nr:hypothetical protein HK099_003831 [Clydaea vesicula]